MRKIRIDGGKVKPLPNETTIKVPVNHGQPREVIWS
jgi:hypothetical protein